MASGEQVIAQTMKIAYSQSSKFRALVRLILILLILQITHAYGLQSDPTQRLLTVLINSDKVDPEDLNYLSVNAGPTAIPSIAELLAHASDAVREAAASSLVFIGGDEAIATLQNLYEKDDRFLPFLCITLASSPDYS
jgi:hypothetical protein